MAEKPLWRMVAGRKVGPYDPAKLRPLVKDGRIGPLDRFSYDGVEWRPASDFSELLRPPTTNASSGSGSLGTRSHHSSPLDSDPLDSEEATAEFESPDEFAPSPSFVPRLPAQGSSSSEEARLLKAIYLLIAFGAGMFFLLICYIILASLLGGPKTDPRPPAPTKEQQRDLPAREVGPPSPGKDPGESVDGTAATDAFDASGDKEPSSDASGAQPAGPGPAPVAAGPEGVEGGSGRDPADAGDSSVTE